MENGPNVAMGSVKSSRRYTRLSTIKDRMIFLARNFEELFKYYDLTKSEEENVGKFFSGLMLRPSY